MARRRWVPTSEGGYSRNSASAVPAGNQNHALPVPLLPDVFKHADVRLQNLLCS